MYTIYISTYIGTYIYAYILRCIHTYTCIYIYIYEHVAPCFVRRRAWATQKALLIYVLSFLCICYISNIYVGSEASGRAPNPFPRPSLYIYTYMCTYIYTCVYRYVYVYRILKPVYSFLRPRTARAARRLAWQGGSFGQHGGAGGWPMMALA